MQVITRELEWWGSTTTTDYEFLINMTHEYKVGIEFVDYQGVGTPAYIKLHGDGGRVLRCLLTVWNNGESIEDRRRWALYMMQLDYVCEPGDPARTDDFLERVANISA